MNDWADVVEPISARGWPPEVSEALGQWRLHAARGYSGRANACWPIGDPGRPLEAAIGAVEAWYRYRGLPPLFRPADVAATEPLRDRLAAAGYRPRKETLVMVGALTASAVDGVVVRQDPDAAFTDVFLGAATDPADAAERIEAIQRLSPPRAFARIDIFGAPAAIGAAAVDSGWAGIFGMRTLSRYRRQGLARRVIAALAGFARGEGAEQAYLQVEASNTPAVALYEGLGFEVGYTYRYWARD
jgi:ribosomal protein S18 acetylase RimI-like enzyme